MPNLIGAIICALSGATQLFRFLVAFFDWLSEVANCFFRLILEDLVEKVGFVIDLKRFGTDQVKARKKLRYVIIFFKILSYKSPKNAILTKRPQNLLFVNSKTPK